MVEYRESELVASIAERVMNENDCFGALQDPRCRIGYQVSTQAKKKDGKAVFADTEKVKDKLKQFLPKDFIITFYEPNTAELSDESLYRLMYHELLHVGFDPDTEDYFIVPHDLEDFREVVTKWGVDWIDGN